jgi:RES domain-containing protein
MRLGFRHCDHRTPFLWQSDAQPAARWHGEGEGPVNYFADTPVGAWAEFLRHEEITDPADLAGVRRSLWVVELPDGDFATPKLSHRVMTGGLVSYTACQAEARRLRSIGAKALEAPAAALKPGTARGWTALPDLTPSASSRDGRVWVLFGPCESVGWPAVVAGAPPAAVLPLVRYF